MKKILLQALIFLLTASVGFAEDKNNFISFTENKGQVKDQNWQPRPDVIFSGNSGNMIYHMRTDGISYQQYRIDTWKEEQGIKGLEGEIVPEQTTIYRTDVYWEGINNNYKIEKEIALAGYNNYYNVPEGTAPALFVKAYKEVWLKNLYNGIDLHYYGSGTTLKYDFVVAPQSDYQQIKIRIAGAKLNIKEDGSLQMITPLGIIEEGKPMAYQGDMQVEAYWELDDNILTIKLGKYNKAEKLYIDPPVREWGTYYGGDDVEFGQACATDALGNIFAAGITASTMSIATAGAHQTVKGTGSNRDAYLIKFNTNGVRQWGTYYGG